MVDGFEDPWTYNYTEVKPAGTGDFPVTSEASGMGYSGLPAVSGSKLGKGTFPTGGSSARIRAHLWNGVQNQVGQPVSLWVTINGDTACGGGLVVKTIDYGSGLVGGYVVGLADRFNGGELQLQLMAHTMTVNGGGGMAFTTAGRLSSADHSSAATVNLGGGTANKWIKIVATLSAVDVTNVLDVVLSDIGGNPVGPGNTGTPGVYQYIDSGGQAVNARANGPAGLFVWAWNVGPDFDDLDIVPEPATLGLLGVGGVLALLRRRR